MSDSIQFRRDYYSMLCALGYSVGEAVRMTIAACDEIEAKLMPFMSDRDLQISIDCNRHAIGKAAMRGLASYCDRLMTEANLLIAEAKKRGLL